MQLTRYPPIPEPVKSVVRPGLEGRGWDTNQRRCITDNATMIQIRQGEPK